MGHVTSRCSSYCEDPGSSSSFLVLSLIGVGSGARLRFSVGDGAPVARAAAPRKTPGPHWNVTVSIGCMILFFALLTL